MTFSVEPEKYSAGYSFIPLGLSGSIPGGEAEYLTNVVYKKKQVISITPVSFGGELGAELTFGTDHKYKIGERLYFDSENNKGNYIVRAVPGNDRIIIDLIVVNTTLGANPFIYAYYGYKIPANPKGKAEMDLSPVLGDFVTRNIIGTNSVYSGVDTRFCYSLIMGDRSVYEFDFWDNIFVTGNIGFRNNTISQSEVPPFQVGDRILIQQEQTTITYRYFVFPDPLNPTINYFLEAGSPIGTAPIFNTVGQTLLLNSQTAPQYNGFTTIRDVLSQRLRFTIPQALSAVAGNDVDVTGFCRPEYNGVHTITDIYFDPGLNEWIIRTDIPFQFNSPAIGGTIKLASGEKSTRFDLLRKEDLCVFNSRWDKREYKKNYNEYVVDGICPPVWILENGTWEDLGVWVDFGVWNDTPTGSEFNLIAWDKISTIYKSYFPTKQFFWRERRAWAIIQPDAFCHLLVHNETPDATEGLWIETFDKEDNQLSLSFLKNNSGNDLDYYAPIGLLDILNSPDLIDNIGTFSEVVSNTDYYVVWAGPEESCGTASCCPKLTLCYGDPLITCVDIELTAVYNPLINGTFSYEGETSYSGFDYDIQVYWSGNRWELTYTGQFGTILMATLNGNIDNCPINEWNSTPRLESLYLGKPVFTSINECDEEGVEVGTDCCLTYTEKIPFLVDTCSQWTKYNLIFKDRRGSWAQWPFKLISRKYIETDRTNFYQQQGTFTDNDFFFNPFDDRGDKSFITRNREKMRLTSDWVSDEQNYIIEDLFKSVEVYLQDSDSGEILGILIENKEYEKKLDRNDWIHNYQFDIIFGNDDVRL